MRKVVAFIFFCFPFLAWSQAFENVKATVEGNKVIISYDLVTPYNQWPYTVEVFGSHDAYASPIKTLSGDVGRNVMPGKNKGIVWDVASELKVFKGAISFELRGAPVIVPLKLESPVTGSSLRRGKETAIQWRGGQPQHPVKLELFKDGQHVLSLGEQPNDGSYVWSVSKDVEKGSGYSLKLSSGSESVSSEFGVRAKVPLALKVIPVAAVAAVVVLLLPDPPPPPDQDLPGAPDPD